MRIVIYNEKWRQKAIDAVKQAGDDYIVTISEPTRSTVQNALLHAVIADISKQVKWCGKKFDLDTWKRLCVAAWLRERNETPDLIPALDGKGFDVIYQPTSKLSILECSQLIDWCYAFGAEQGVEFSEQRIKEASGADA